MIAVFCPRLGSEDEGEWKKRWETCRRYARSHTRAECLDLFNLHDLMICHATTPLRKIIVARLGFYELEFHNWLRRSRVEVVDAMASDIHAPAWLEAMRK